MNNITNEPINKNSNFIDSNNNQETLLNEQIKSTNTEFKLNEITDSNILLNSKEQNFNHITTKEDFIAYCNNCFRTILSYGTSNDLVPMGQFKIKDIELNTEKNQCIILEQVDNPSINIIIPRAAFSSLIEIAFKNSRDLGLTDQASFLNLVNALEESASDKVLHDETLKNLQEAKVMPFDEYGITFMRDGKIEKDYTCSICPLTTGLGPLEFTTEKQNIETSRPTPPPPPASAATIVLPNSKTETKKEQVYAEPEIYY